VRRADQGRHHEVGLGGLDLLDGRAEIGDVEREEVGLHHFAAIVLGVFLHPFGGDLAVIVVGGERVDLFPPVLEAVFDENLGVMRGRHPVNEDIAIADAAFIRHIVKIERLVLVEHRPDHFPRSGGDSAMHHGDLVLQRRFLRVLGVELHIGLRIEADDLDLAAEQATGLVHFTDCEIEDVVHRLAGRFEAPGKIVHARNDNRISRRGMAHQRRRENGRGYSALQ
jgi:hypothetical protein